MKESIYNRQRYILHIYILRVLLAFFFHLTTLRIDDKDYEFLQKYKIRIKDVFKIGLEKYKTEILSEAYDLLAKMRKNVYILEQKIYMLEQENIYKSQKIYTLDDVFHEFCKANRISFTDRENLNWLKPRIERLRENGCAKSTENVLNYLKRRYENENRSR
jgi:hypothetical protein